MTTTDPLAYPLTGEPMTLEPGKTYVLRSLRHLNPDDIQRIRAHGDSLGVTFVVLDESLDILAARCGKWSKPRCVEPDCRDYGDQDFGGGTCPASHSGVGVCDDEPRHLGDCHDSARDWAFLPVPTENRDWEPCDGVCAGLGCSGDCRQQVSS